MHHYDVNNKQASQRRRATLTHTKPKLLSKQKLHINKLQGKLTARNKYQHFKMCKLHKIKVR